MDASTLPPRMAPYVKSSIVVTSWIHVGTPLMETDPLDLSCYHAIKINPVMPPHRTRNTNGNYSCRIKLHVRPVSREQSYPLRNLVMNTRDVTPLRLIMDTLV